MQKGLLNLLVAYAEALLISFPPCKPPRKICSWDFLNTGNGFTDTRGGCGMSVWCIDVHEAATEPGSGVRMGACGAPAEPRSGGAQVIAWSYRPAVQAGGTATRWWHHWTCRGAWVVESELQGMHAPIRIPKKSYCKISICNTPPLRLKKRWTSSGGAINLSFKLLIFDLFSYLYSLLFVLFFLLIVWFRYLRLWYPHAIVRQSFSSSMLWWWIH